MAQVLEKTLPVLHHFMADTRMGEIVWERMKSHLKTSKTEKLNSQNPFRRQA
jgi:hypothetical protein